MRMLAFYGLSFLNEFLNTRIFSTEMLLHHCTSIPNRQQQLKAHITCFETCTPNFPFCHIFGEIKLALWSEFHISVEFCYFIFQPSLYLLVHTDEQLCVFTYDYQSSGLCPSPDVFKKQTTFRKLDLLLSSHTKQAVPILCGCLERASPNYYSRE
jgi:hypothetical protein